MKILITGASGFVGSHVLEVLQDDASVKLRIACRDQKKLPVAFQGDIQCGNLYNKEYRENILKDIEVLINAFAWTSAWGHAAQSRQYFLEPTLALYEEAIAKGIKHIINISSTSTAAPDTSADPMSRGIKRKRWPHMDNVVVIEDFLRERAGDNLNVMNLRLGIFAGKRYALGMLPILLPRLKTHLVPWVANGQTACPIIDGRDIGQAVALAAKTELSGWQSFNVLGPEVPTVRQVIEFIHAEFAYPKPHFNVPFPLAYSFAQLMEWLDPLVPWEPLVTRSIVHLLEETAVDNRRAGKMLGYHPQYGWREAIRNQIHEMEIRQPSPMPLVKPLA